MHNMGIVVESLDDAVAFFTELGLMLEGRMMVEGEWAGRVDAFISFDGPGVDHLAPGLSHRIERVKFAVDLKAGFFRELAFGGLERIFIWGEFPFWQ